MTYYELFKKSTKEEMASMLAGLLAGVMEGMGAEDIPGIYEETLEFLDMEASA